MKIFTYSYYIPYGSGAGIVIAESKEEAIRMIKEKPYGTIEDGDLEVTEIDISKPLIVDMSCVE